MPNIISSIDHLADLPLYETVKPYVVLSTQLDSGNITTKNVVFESRENIEITDIRGKDEQYTLDTAGFQIMQHKTDVERFETMEDLIKYQEETAACLKEFFNAEYVLPWQVKKRKNKPLTGIVQQNLRDWTAVDGPAKGAHNDVTIHSGPIMLKTHLPEEIKKRYLKPGYRFRIVNTWRSLIPVLEDNPLAFCDFRSVHREDLIACDRVIPTRAGEVYYLKYKPEHHWCWLEHMTPEEPLLFIMWDSAPGPQARFQNPHANESAERRVSVETRNIIITKL
ncbi:hypothetical protein B7494_g4531 [Chlorociboria aeruginascens]|nr:hypothetical protein B7494_g4531 [Chlorociboria aeruginascens]